MSGSKQLRKGWIVKSLPVPGLGSDWAVNKLFLDRFKKIRTFDGRNFADKAIVKLTPYDLSHVRIVFRAE